jgi:hypothetical protein
VPYCSGRASAAFLTSHFGFRQDMAANGFVSLTREDAGMNVVFLRRGLALLPDDQRDDEADGVILAFVRVADYCPVMIVSRASLVQASP